MEKWGGIVQTLLNARLLPLARPDSEILPEGKRRNEEENVTFHDSLTLTGSRVSKASLTLL